MINILGISGRKQAGKNTSFNYILALTMKELNIVQGQCRLDSDGDVVVTDILGDKKRAGCVIQDRSMGNVDLFFLQHIDWHLKQYSFADLLKKEICIKVLGLSQAQCFGTDEEKNSVTHLRWEDMPGIIATDDIWSEDGNMLCDGASSYVDGKRKGGVSASANEMFSRINLIPHEPGPMTAREVMQFVGTEIFRKMYYNVWVDATIRQIEQEEATLAVITDCRFPNEVEGIQKAGGKVVRLTRTPFPSDNHASETALDKEHFDWNKFDLVIENDDIGIIETNTILLNKMAEWGWAQANELQVTTDG